MHDFSGGLKLINHRPCYNNYIRRLAGLDAISHFSRCCIFENHFIAGRAFMVAEMLIKHASKDIRT